MLKRSSKKVTCTQEDKCKCAKCLDTKCKKEHCTFCNALEAFIATEAYECALNNELNTTVKTGSCTQVNDCKCMKCANTKCREEHCKFCENFESYLATPKEEKCGFRTK